jgi:hypothetical protein
MIMMITVFVQIFAIASRRFMIPNGQSKSIFAFTFGHPIFTGMRLRTIPVDGAVVKFAACSNPVPDVSSTEKKCLWFGQRMKTKKDPKLSLRAMCQVSADLWQLVSRGRGG